jgi:hypothetical protein
VPLTSSLTGLDYSGLQIKTKTVNCRTTNSKPVKLEVNGTVMLSPLVFPDWAHKMFLKLPPGVNVIKLFSFITVAKAK